MRPGLRVVISLAVLGACVPSVTELPCAVDTNCPGELVCRNARCVGAGSAGGGAAGGMNTSGGAAGGQAGSSSAGGLAGGGPGDAGPSDSGFDDAGLMDAGTSDGGGSRDAGTDAGDATLTALAATTGLLSPPFQPTVVDYDLDLVLSEVDVSFTPTASAPTETTITVDGQSVVSGAASPTINLTPGDRDVDLSVVSNGGAMKTYRVHVHRGVDALASLAPSTGTLSPVFDPLVTSYRLGLPLSTSALGWTPTSLTPRRASITLNGAVVTSGTPSAATTLTIGDNPTSFVVTPQTRPARSYVVGVVRGSDAAASFSVSYVGGALTNPVTPTFDPATTTYAMDVGVSVQRVQVTVTPFDSTATITVGGSPAPANAPSPPIALNLGVTAIPIVVTAPAGAPRTYLLNVTRASSLLQQVYAKASNTGAGDGFGASVSLWGDTLAVGAPSEGSGSSGVGGNQNDNSMPQSGAVYVFTRTGTTWSQQAYIKASNPNGSDRFGLRVAVWGDTLAVSATGEASAAAGIGGNQADDSLINSGAVYVFTRAGSTWSQQAYVKASNPGADDNFGSALTLWGDTLAVAASGEDSAATGIGGNQADNSAVNSGAVYVFARSGATWSQQAYVKASNAASVDVFGASLALWAETLVVGAEFESSAATGVGGNQADNSAVQSGAAYVFTRTGTAWSQQAYLKASNTEANDRFGHSVAVSGDTIAVSAYLEDSAATGVGGNQADNSASLGGAVYVFTRTGTVWSQQAYLKASNTNVNDTFGSALALWGDTLAVVAIGESSAATGIGGNQADNSAASSGAIYVFGRNSGVWSQQAYVKASNTGASDGFGGSVAVWGDTIVAGASGEDSSATGLGGNQGDNSAMGSGAVYLLR